MKSMNEYDQHKAAAQVHKVCSHEKQAQDKFTIDNMQPHNATNDM